MTVGQPDFRPQPELGAGAALANMDVSRFQRHSFIGKEEKAKALVAENDWHPYRPILPHLVGSRASKRLVVWIEQGDPIKGVSEDGLHQGRLAAP